MDKEKIALLKKFIELYKKAEDKEFFIDTWYTVLSAEPCDEPLTLEDAYNSAYGRALEQL